MASSRPDPAEAITRCYEQALAALHADDLERASALLIEVDRLLGGLDVTVLADDPAFEPARAAHRALCREVDADREHTGALIAHQRKGQRTLRAYGGRTPVVGTRVERDA